MCRTRRGFSTCDFDEACTISGRIARTPSRQKEILAEATSLLLLAKLRRKTRATLDALAVERAGADPLFITLSLIERVRAMAPPRAAPRPAQKRGKKDDLAPLRRGFSFGRPRGSTHLASNHLTLPNHF